MHFQFQVIVCVALAVVIVPVIVTGKPQQQQSDPATTPPVSDEHLQNSDDFSPETEPTDVSMAQKKRKVVEIDLDDDTIDYTSPQPFSEKGKSGQSSRLCGEDELMHEKSGICYQRGVFTPGIDSPCHDEFEVFTELPDKLGFGSCCCLRFRGATYRPVVYWEKSDRCFWLYDKGPCENGEWLVYGNQTNDDGIKPVICGKRTCRENNLQDESRNFPPVWLEHEGKCLRTETPNPEFCGDVKKRVYFSNEQSNPICSNRRPFPYWLLRDISFNPRAFLNC